MVTLPDVQFLMPLPSRDADTAQQISQLFLVDLEVRHTDFEIKAILPSALNTLKQFLQCPCIEETGKSCSHQVLPKCVKTGSYFMLSFKG